LVHFLRAAELPSALLGPTALFALTTMGAWLIGCFTWVALLRASSQRYAAFAPLEVAAVGGVLASIFAGHREGYINRPFFLVDPLWTRGWDPTPVFLGLGALVALVLVLLVATQNTRRRSVLDVAILSVLVLMAFLVVPVAQIKDWHKEWGGGQGQKEREKGQNSGGQGQNGQSGGQQGGQPQQGSQGGGQQGGQQQQGQSQSGQQGGQTQQGQSQGGQQNPQKQSYGEQEQPDFQNRTRNPGKEPLAVVIFRDEYDSPVGYYYFRQAAFSQYNGQKLIRPTVGQLDRDVPDNFPTEKARLPVPEFQDFRFAAETTEVKEGALDPTAFKRLDTTVALLTSHSRPFGLVNPLEFAPHNNPDPQRFERAYSVTSMVLVKEFQEVFAYQPGSPSWDDATWEHYLAGPKDPRYQQLAEEILLTLPEKYRDIPMARVLAVKLWMEKNCVYSLTTSHEAAADPVADFLFGDRTGYCVYLGHAACFLYRTMGIPSRVAAGYAVDQNRRGRGSSLMIVQGDGHEWPEVYLDGLGWTPMDISTERTLEPPSDQVDQGLQQMMGDMARKDKENPPPDEPPKTDLQELLRRVMATLMHALPVALLLTLLALFWLKYWRRLRPYFAPVDRLAVVVYRATLDRLADRGFLRRSGDTRGEFARRLQDVCPTLLELTERHLEAALGKGPRSADRAVYLDLMRQTVQEADLKSPLARRILFALNPISWWWVR
ncbi:MAG: transglutaminase domain-containing protein, partial [Candidatus Eremiobacterota bacterium]